MWVECAAGRISFIRDHRYVVDDAELVLLPDAMPGVWERLTDEPRSAGYWIYAA